MEPPEIQPSKPNAWAPLRITEFRHLMLGRFLFIMGLRMMGTLVAWWLYDLTGNPLLIGMIGLAEFVPAFLLALPAGHVIDRKDKRKLMLGGVSGYFLCVVCLFILALFLSKGYAKASVVIGMVFVVIFVTGMVRAFTGPSFHAILAQTVPRILLPRAISWNQGVWLTASVLGHASAGFLIALKGTTNTLTAILILIIISFSFLYRILPKPPENENRGEKATWESLAQGLRFVFNTRPVLGALALDMFAVLFGGAVAMVPVFAKDILNIGPIGFGWLNAAADVGAIISVIFVTFFPIQKNQGRIMMLCVAGFGVCILLFGLSKIFWLSFAALLLSGIMDGISMIIRGTILQLQTPDSLRGRVMSVNSMFINSSNELGQFESGLAARMLGIVPSVVFGGCMTILVVIITWFKAPDLRKMEY
jgi:MFS family permease